MKKLIFQFSGYTGWDSLMAILPKSLQVRMIARAWLKRSTTLEGVMPDPTVTPMIINVPWGSFRITDQKGRVEPCTREYIPM